MTPLLAATASQTTAIDVRWACSDDEVREAQRLRHRIFVHELGARLDVPPGTPAGHDADRFDPFCEHLIVRQRHEDGEPGAVIGTYRVLTPDAARRAGGLYSDGEFDLTPLAAWRPRVLELGRSCVHPDWRTGGVILALWAELAAFVQRAGLEAVVGCASISLRDGGHEAASLWHRLRRTHPIDAALQVRPKLALPIHELRTDLDVEPPPLVKGYLRCGARILGTPAWDPDFNTADLPMLMCLADMPARYKRHFLEAAA